MLDLTHIDSVFPLIQGFLLYGSLIIVIGPQNLFILRQGLLSQFLFSTAFVSTFIDFFLITLGIGGVGTFIAAESTVLNAVTIAGILFLLWTGGRSLYAAGRGRPMGDGANKAACPIGRRATIVTAISFSLLNPGAYIDTFVMLGSRSGTFQTDQRLLFGFGAILASTCWFFALAYGASKLAPLFRSPIAWRALDLASGCIMIGVAGLMTTSLYQTLV